MSEIINTYKLDNPSVATPMDRDLFYNEQIGISKFGEEPTRAIEIVDILIFNSYGELTIQKRSLNKNHNPGLLDKSIGGHMQNGDSSEYTAMVETIQELQTPSIVLKDQPEFEKTYKLLRNYLETVAVIKHLSTELIFPTKIINGEKIKVANKIHIYLGVYDGRMRPVDREAKGLLFYSLSELKKEMSDTPEIFTNDLHIIMKEYEEDISRFVEYIKK